MRVDPLLLIAEDVAHRGPRGGRVGCSVREMNQKCLHGTVWVGEETFAKVSQKLRCCESKVRKESYAKVKKKSCPAQAMLGGRGKVGGLHAAVEQH